MSFGAPEHQARQILPRALLGQVEWGGYALGYPLWKGKVMTKLLTGLTVGAAMMLGVSAAQAEPLTLTDSQMDGVTAGAKRFVFTLNVANAHADAKAIGRVSFADAWTFTFTKPGVAKASAASSSCSGFCV